GRGIERSSQVPLSVRASRPCVPTKRETSEVLPIPGSPETSATRPEPPAAAARAASSAARASSRSSSSTSATIDRPRLPGQRAGEELGDRRRERLSALLPRVEHVPTAEVVDGQPLRDGGVEPHEVPQAVARVVRRDEVEPA